MGDVTKQFRTQTGPKADNGQIGVTILRTERGSPLLITTNPNKLDAEGKPERRMYLHNRARDETAGFEEIEIEGHKDYPNGNRVYIISGGLITMTQQGSPSFSRLVNDDGIPVKPHLISVSENPSMPNEARQQIERGVNYITFGQQWLPKPPVPASAPAPASAPG